MGLAGVLSQVVDIKGVTSAAVVNGEGELIDGVSSDHKDMGFVSGIIASGMASSRVLADLLGEGDVSQTMIEYEDGPVILMPLGESGAHVMFATLEDISTLGRVRFQLKKLMPSLANAVAA